MVNLRDMKVLIKVDNVSLIEAHIFIKFMRLKLFDILIIISYNNKFHITKLLKSFII